MFTARVTSKGQATIPVDVRQVLGIHPGDIINFEVIDHKAVISKIDPLDEVYHLALSKTLAQEWDSPEDNEAYENI